MKVALTIIALLIFYGLPANADSPKQVIGCSAYVAEYGPEEADEKKSNFLYKLRIDENKKYSPSAPIAYFQLEVIDRKTGEWLSTTEMAYGFSGGSVGNFVLSLTRTTSRQHIYPSLLKKNFEGGSISSNDEAPYLIITPNLGANFYYTDWSDIKVTYNKSLLDKYGEEKLRPDFTAPVFWFFKKCKK